MRHPVCGWSTLVILLSISCSNLARGQISIKDTVSITPNPSRISASVTTTGSHTLRFEASLSVPIFSRVFTYRIVDYYYYSRCSNVRQDTGTGGIVYEAPLSSGTYQFDFQPRVAELFPHQICNATLTVSVDGEIKMQASASFEGGSAAVFALWP